jgi:hypothetical protein
MLAYLKDNERHILKEDKSLLHGCLVIPHRQTIICECEVRSTAGSSVPDVLFTSARGSEKQMYLA